MKNKEVFIHAENNHNILSSADVKLFNPPKPEEMKVIIWGKELCSGAEWNDFLKCVEEKTKENESLKQQIQDLQEQLKNAIVPKFKSNDVAWRIHWYTNEIERVVIVNTEIKIVAGTQIIYLIAVLDEGITLSNLDKEFFKNVLNYTDQVEESELFATKAEAEQRLSELRGEI